ncbi:MAG: hypothetical protein LUE92_04795 [Clostridiales bacterium]|nr:hypothetical protein [Clostridiales bacterium]
MAKKKAEKESTFVPVEEQPYPVPENWCWTHISDVSDVVTGGTPSKKILHTTTVIFRFLNLRI